MVISRGHLLKFQNKDVFYSMKFGLSCKNAFFHRKNEDHDHVDEMLHHAAFHLGDSCLAMYK